MTNHPNRKKGSVLERIKAIVDTGSETARSPGGWDLRKLRFAYYSIDGHWALASLDRSGEINPVVNANSRSAMHRLLDLMMDEMERHVHKNPTLRT